MIINKLLEFMRYSFKSIYIKYCLMWFVYRRSEYFKNGIYHFGITNEGNIILYHNEKRFPGNIHLISSSNTLLALGSFKVRNGGVKSKCNSVIITNNYLYKFFDTDNSLAFVKCKSNEQLQDVIYKYQQIKNYIEVAEYNAVDDLIYSEEIIDGETVEEAKDESLLESFRELILKYSDYKRSVEASVLGANLSKEIFDIFETELIKSKFLYKEVKAYANKIASIMSDTKIVILHKDYNHKNCFIHNKSLKAFDIGDSVNHRYLDYFDMSKFALKAAGHANKPILIKKIYDGYFDRELNEYFKLDNDIPGGKIFLILAIIAESLSLSRLEFDERGGINIEKINIYKIHKTIERMNVYLKC